MRAFYLTTPIYYVNDLPHIGHIYTTVVADVVARYRRMSGDSVYFLTGTDEHGQKIERAAAKEGIAPIELADRVVERYHQLWRQLGISNDGFIRTTEAAYRRRWRSSGASRRGPTARTRAGTAPAARCSTRLELTQPGGRCRSTEAAASGAPRKTCSSGSAVSDRRFSGTTASPTRAAGQPRKMRTFVESGLRDLSLIARIWPGAFRFQAPGQTVYVWFDALANYITALGWSVRRTALRSLLGAGRPVSISSAGHPAVPRSSGRRSCGGRAAALPRSGRTASGCGTKMASVGNVVQPDHRGAASGSTGCATSSPRHGVRAGRLVLGRGLRHVST